MTRWMLVFSLGGCVAQDERGAVDPVRAVIGCKAQGERARGPFHAPYAYFSQEVDADLAPLILESASDPEHQQVLDQTTWIYDAEQRLVARELDDDGDRLPEWYEQWTHAPDGQVQTWSLDDARGQHRAAEWYIHGREGRLFRMLADDDGDDVVDRIVEDHWDPDGRLVREDIWNPTLDQPLSRKWVSYDFPAPALDRFEQVDTSGDNIPDIGTSFRYGIDGMLRTSQTTGGAVTDYTWDDGGRLLASIQIGPNRSVSWEATYNELGLPTWTREDTDDGPDGALDSTEITRWEWDCDD